MASLKAENGLHSGCTALTSTLGWNLTRVRLLRGQATFLKLSTIFIPQSQMTEGSPGSLHNPLPWTLKPKCQALHLNINPTCFLFRNLHVLVHGCLLHPQLVVVAPKTSKVCTDLYFLF